MFFSKKISSNLSRLLALLSLCSFVLFARNQIFATTYTVVNTNDSGAGSLREAIISANANPGADIIDFDPGVNGTISLLTDLDVITEAVEIQGETATSVTIDNANNYCFSFGGADGSVVRGVQCQNSNYGLYVDATTDLTIGGTSPSHFMTFDGHAQAGIFLTDSSDVHILNSQIGTTTGNGTGILVEGASSNILIGNESVDGRVIVVNSANEGIHLFDVTSAEIVNTYVGTVDGTNPEPNGGSGVRIGALSSAVSVGTATNNAPYTNVIGGNTGHGLLIEGDDNRVQNTHVGVSTDGLNILANGNSGINIKSSGNIIGPDDISDKNVLSGNTASGVMIESGENNTIQNSYIGINSDGDNAIANGDDGVSLQSSNNTVGIADGGNLISGNTFNGVKIFTGANGNIIQENHIGLQSDGSSAMPNDTGIFNLGDTASILNNVISGNGEYAYWGSDSDSAIIEGNIFGRDTANTSSIRNGNHVIYLSDGSSNNRIGGTTNLSENIFDAEPGFFAVRLDTSAGNGNEIQRNRFIAGSPKISLVAPSNESITAPSIDSGDSSVLVGTAEANATIQIFVDEAWAGTTEADALGDWELHAFIDGAEAQALQTNATGSSSELSAVFIVNADVTPPSDPVISSPDGNLTSTAYTLEGDKDPYSSIYVNGVEELAADANASFSIPLTLVQGVQTLDVSSQDYSGNESNDVSHIVNVDSIVPADPILDFETTTSSASTLLTGSGTEVGAQVWLDGVDTGETVNGLGDFALELNLTTGLNTFEIVIRDAHGNESDAVSAEITRRVVSGSSGGGSPSPSRPPLVSPSPEEPAEESLEETPEENTTEEVTEETPEVIIEEENPEEVIEETPEEKVETPQEPAPLPLPELENLTGLEEDIFELTLEETFDWDEVDTELILSSFQQEDPKTWGQGNVVIQSIPREKMTEKVPEGESLFSYIYGLNPEESDSDGDGIEDILEVVLGLDTATVDSDNDGIPDLQDPEPRQYQKRNWAEILNEDANNQDSDEDGLSDIYEKNLGLNSKASDTDEDGWNDAQELLLLGTDPREESELTQEKPWFTGLNTDTLIEGPILLKGFYKEKNSALELIQILSTGEEALLARLSTDDEGQWVFVWDGVSKDSESDKIFLQIRDSEKEKSSAIRMLQKGALRADKAEPQLQFIEKDGALESIELVQNSEFSGASPWIIFIQSSIYSQSILADLSSQNYGVNMPPNLEPGSHRVHLARINTLNGNVEDAKSFDFMQTLPRASILPSPAKEASKTWIWISFGLALIFFTIPTLYARHKRKIKN